MADEKERTEPIVGQLKDNGDILQKMAAENAKISDVYGLLEQNQQSLDNIHALTHNIETVLRRQEDLLKSIFNLLSLWGRQGGISDQSKAGTWNIDNPLSYGNNALIDINGQVRNSTDRLVEVNRELAEQAARSQAKEEKQREQTDTLTKEIREARASLTTLSSMSDQFIVETLKDLRRHYLPSSMAQRHTQADWDRMIGQLQGMLFQQESNKPGLNTDTEAIMKYLNAENNAQTRAAIDAAKEAVGNALRDKYQIPNLSNADLERFAKTPEEQLLNEFGDVISQFGENDTERTDMFRKFQEDFFNNQVDLENELISRLGGSSIPNVFSDVADQLQVTSGLLRAASQADGTAGKAIEASGGVAKELVGTAVAEGIGADIGAAVGTAIGGPVGTAIGAVAGDMIGNYVGEKVEEGFKALGDLVDSWQKSAMNKRDKIIEAGFTKLRQDVADMSTYQLDIYSKAVNDIYSAWDKNLSQVNATQGYTKEQLNTLQDSVAQKLEDLGFENAINASDFTDSLVAALNANLSGQLAEVFATESMILQKAIPEFNPASMAEQFAAVWTNAVKEGGSGEDAMVRAMEQIAGATRAIRESTDGNNQFIRQVPAYFAQAQEMVARAGGSVDQVAELTTQMMAAEGPLAALTPQLSGFTGELVNILANQNNSSAVALRAIMHDINENVGVSATDFMKSFMDDTKGTLVTAFDAIQQFMDKNQSPGAQQEFYQAMSDLFGISSEKIAQIDFGYISDELAKTNANLNTAALLDAESLVQQGETETLEQQLVNNTANMLLAQNAVRDTLDNALMRKLEQNEISMEKLIYSANATQSVDLASNTLEFFKRISDLVLSLLDPLGIIRSLNSLFEFTESATRDLAMYAKARDMSVIESATGNSSLADRQTEINTGAGAAAAVATVLKNEFAGGPILNALVQDATANYRLADSMSSTISAFQESQEKNAQLAAASLETAQTIGSYGGAEDRKAQQEAEFQEQLATAQNTLLQNQMAKEAKEEALQESLSDIKSGVQSIDTSAQEALPETGASLADIAANTKSIADWTTGWFKEQVELYWVPVQEDVENLGKNWEWFRLQHQVYMTNSLSQLIGIYSHTNNTLGELKSTRTDVGSIKTENSQNTDSIVSKLNEVQTQIVNVGMNMTGTSDSRNSVIEQMHQALKDFTTAEKESDSSLNLVATHNGFMIDLVSKEVTGFRNDSTAKLQAANLSLDAIKSTTNSIENSSKNYFQSAKPMLETIRDRMSADSGVLMYLKALKESTSEFVDPMQRVRSFIGDGADQTLASLKGTIQSAADGITAAIRDIPGPTSMEDTNSRLDRIYKAISTLIEMQWNSPTNKAMVGAYSYGFGPEFQEILDIGAAPEFH